MASQTTEDAAITDATDGSAEWQTRVHLAVSYRLWRLQGWTGS